MRILSVQLKNIKSHRDRTLNFSEGINVLSGPNGIGKSTIFEAIGYALFGVDAQSFVGNVERFVSIGEKKGEVRVEFQPNDVERYLASRTVGTPAKWLLFRQLAGGYEVEDHKDAKETETRLKELLGLDNGRALAEQFEMVIGPFQHDFLGPFVIRQPTKRRDKFDEILGIDTWRKTFNETKLLSSTIKLKVEALQNAIGPLEEQLKELPIKKLQVQQVTDGLQQAKELLMQKQVLDKELARQLEDFEQREQKLKAIAVEIDKLQERVGHGKEVIETQKLAVANAHRAQQMLRENEQAKLAYEQAEQSLMALRERLQAQRQLEQEVAAFKTEVGTVNGKLETETAAISQAEKNLHEEEARLERSRESLVVSDEQQRAAGRVPEVREAIAQLRTQLGLLQGKQDGLKDGQERLAEGICPFFQEPCQNIADTPPQDVFSEKFISLEREQQSLEKRLVELSREEEIAQQAERKVREVAAQLKGLAEQEAQFRRQRKSLEERIDNLGRLKEDLARTRTGLDAKQKELDSYGQLQKEQESAEKEKRKHQEAWKLYLANQQQAAELEKRQADLEKFEKHLRQLQEELAEKVSALKEARQDYAGEEHQKLRQEKEQLAQQIGALGQRQDNLDKELSRLNGEIEKLRGIEADIKAKHAQIKKYAGKEKLVKFLRNKVFRNVSAHLSERFRNEISQRADRIYRTIAEVDEELCWGENYQIVLRDMAAGEIRERVDDQLSGGQTMSAVVALRLALLQTIGARIAFFDEPTSNLDASRRENLAHAFRAIDVGREEVTEHWYDQLFLISHDVAFAEITDQIVALDD